MDESVFGRQTHLKTIPAETVNRENEAMIEIERTQSML